MSASEIMNMSVIYSAILICFYAVYKIFSKPLNLVFKLLFKMCVSGIFIFLLNMFLVQNSIHIGINLVTCLVVALLGIPGALMLCFI